MMIPLLVVLAVSLTCLLLLGLRAVYRSRQIAQVKSVAPREAVWLGVVKRGARLFRSRFRYFRPGPAVPSWRAKTMRPIRALLSGLLDIVPELRWAVRA